MRKHWTVISECVISVVGNNFSHRILHLSFGDVVPGIVSPLDGEEKIVNESNWQVTNININLIIDKYWFNDTQSN